MNAINLKKQVKNAPHHQNMEERLNTLRAGVLGSNDGILTVVGVLFSVAVATPNQFTIFIAGLADLLACAFSMGSGEYASVSTQKDTEKAVVAQEERLLRSDFDGEFKLVVDHYVSRGVTHETATKMATSLMAKQPLETMVNVKYDLQLGHYMNPWDAAFSSMIAAAVGGVFPLVAMTLAPVTYQWPATILAVCFSVALTGLMSAKLGNGLVKTAMIRNVLIGIVTMIIHYAIGLLL